MSFPSPDISSSSNQGSYSMPPSSRSTPPTSRSGEPKISDNSAGEKFDPQTGLPTQQLSSAANQGDSTKSMASAEQARVQGATEEFNLPSNVATEIGTEEFDVQDQSDQRSEFEEEQSSGENGITKTKGRGGFQGRTSSRTGEEDATEISTKGEGSWGEVSQGLLKGMAAKGGGVTQRAGGGGVGMRGKGRGTLAQGVTQHAGGGLAQKITQHTGGGAVGMRGKGGLSSKASPGSQVKSSILGDMASSVVKDVEDTACGVIYGATNALKTAYVDIYGVPAIFPPEDTFNVYVAECEVETLNNNVQWTSINAQVAAINGLSQEQETEENNNITEILKVISENAAARAAGQKATATANVAEWTSIGVASALIICSAACYASGVGALGPGEACDAAAAVEIGAATADATADAAAGSAAAGSAAAGSEAVASSMTLTQLASWQFMGITSLIMATPAGTDATNDLTASLEKDGLSAEDASWVSMAIITASMIVAGGLIEVGGSLLSASGKVAESAAEASATTATKAVSTAEKEAASTLTLSDLLTSLNQGVSSVAEASYQAVRSMLVGLGRLAWGAGKAVLKFGEDSLAAIYKAVEELFTRPATAIWTVMKVTFRMLTKIGEGFYKLGPNLSAFAEAATADSWAAAGAALVKGIGSCLPSVMALGQSAEMGLDVLKSTLDLKEAVIEAQSAQYSEDALEDQAYANSIENSVNACNQALNQMIQVTNSMMTSTEQTMGSDEIPPLA